MSDDRDRGGRSARDRDEAAEMRIRAWMADSAPARLPASIRETLERETSRPRARGGEGFGRFVRPSRPRAERAIQLAAAVAVLAVVGSTAAIYGLSRRSQPSGPVASAPASGAIGSVATPRPSGSPSPRASAPTPRTTAPPALAVTWTDVRLPENGSYEHSLDVHGLPGGGFAAFDPAGAAGVRVLRSPDAVTWSATGTIGQSGSVSAFAADASGSLYLAAITPSPAAASPDGAVWYSSDLASWRRASFGGQGAAGSAGSVEKLVRGGGRFVALTRNDRGAVGVWTSASGDTWDAATGLPTGTVPFDAFWRDGRFLLFATATGGGGAATGGVSIWTSTDGTVWSATNGSVPSAAGPLTFVARQDGSLIGFEAGVGGGSAGAVRAWESSDGLAWAGPIETDLPGPQNSVGVRFDSVGARLLAVSSFGAELKVWESQDGLAWTPLAAPNLGSAGEVVRAGIDDDGSRLLVFGSVTTNGPGQTAHPARFVFARRVGDLP